MSLEGLEDGGLDLVLLLPEELLGRSVQQVGVLHDLHLIDRLIIVWLHE